MVSGNSSTDVTAQHVFVGYKPVIIALPFLSSDTKPTQVKLEFIFEGRIVASLSLAKIFEVQSKNMDFLFYEAVSGSHAFINKFHRVFNNTREKLAKHRPGNVDLPGRLHDLVRIAYSFPRQIALITTQQGEVMNLFPTDLHGQLSLNYYVSSLRIGGKAQQQVEQTKKIVVSRISADTYEMAYRLGKNHMTEMKPAAEFEISAEVSKLLKFKLPASVREYFELEVESFFDVGIHRIFIYRILHRQSISEGDTLAHIHQYYVQWRLNKGIETKMLLRK